MYVHLPRSIDLLRSAYARYGCGGRILSAHDCRERLLVKQFNQI